MVGEDDRAILSSQPRWRQGLTGQIEIRVVTHRWQSGNVWVVVGDDGTLCEEQFEDLEAGRLARVIDVLFVGHPQEGNLALFDGLAAIIEGIGDLAHHEAGHGGVDFARQFDEAGGETELSCDPGEVEGVDGDAVAAEAGARVEGLESEWFGLRRLNDLPDVYAHAVVEDL